MDVIDRYSVLSERCSSTGLVLLVVEVRKDIFGKGLNMPAPLDIQWPKCFQLQGASPPDPLTRGSADGPPVIGSCAVGLLAMVPPQPLTPSAAYGPPLEKIPWEPLHIMPCYTHKMAIVSHPMTEWFAPAVAGWCGRRAYVILLRMTTPDLFCFVVPF